MKAECRICGRVLETPPDPVFDAKRDERERRTFFQMIAHHIDPSSRQCSTEREKIIGRYMAMIQDNGWFQRWRLLHMVKCDEPAMLERAEQWRDYLNVITSPLPESGEAPEPEKPTLVN